MSDVAIILQRELVRLRQLRDTHARRGKPHLLPAIDELISQAEAQLRQELGVSVAGTAHRA